MPPPDPPAPRRRYDTTRRRAAAQERRRRVLDAAARMFAADGWSATTVPRVAAEAGVSPELITSTFGTKAGLAMAAMRSGSFGDGSDVASATHALSLDDCPDAACRLDRAVEFVCRSQRAMAPLIPVLVQAADQDTAAAAAVADGERRHLAACRELSRGLAGGEVADDVVDEVYLLTRAESYLTLTRDRGWDDDRYAAWVRAALERLLLPGRD